VIETESKPFGKYNRYGAYHWREIHPFPTRYNAVLTARYHVLLDAIDPQARQVLDVGCGDGTLTFALTHRSQRVCGIDDALLPLRLADREFARRRPSPHPLLAQADARQLPFADGAFDCVVLADVLEHIAEPDVVLREAHRILRTRGQILLTTPRRQDNQTLHEYHCHEYSGAELRDLLAQSFTTVQVQAFRPVRATRLYERRILGRKLFRIAINCLAIAGWNPLATKGSLAEETAFTDLCASGRKA
jgi:2-polyprenyl-3-methyl-5-hydroxy-6-metoxy-1,4-benzoquinol methylase